MNNDVLRALDILKDVNTDYSYELICKMSEEQKKEYHDLLEDFLRMNSMKSTDKSAPENLNQKKGKALENLVAHLMRVSGDLFQVKQNLRTTTNEIDQVFQLTTKGKLLLTAGILNKKYDLFLGECKNYNKAVDVTYTGKFCSLLLTNQIQLGLLFSYFGVSGSGWNYAAGLIKKFYLHKEKEEDRYCIISINKDDFIAIDEGANLLQIIEDKMLALRLDTDYRKHLSRHPAE